MVYSVYGRFTRHNRLTQNGEETPEVSKQESDLLQLVGNIYEDLGNVDSRPKLGSLLV